MRSIAFCCGNRVARIASLVVGLLVALGILAGCGGTGSDGTGSTGSNGEWQEGGGEEWQKVLEAAKEEGEVVVMGHPALAQPMAEAFERNTGIRIEYLGGSSSERSTRLEREARANSLTADVSLGGGTELLTMLPDGLLEPIGPQLMLPSVTESENWIDGEIKWMDSDRQYLLEGSNWVHGWPVVNTDEIEPDSINSWQDLLKPEYKGKIASHDPRGGGPGPQAAIYLADVFGTDFVEKLYVGQEVTYTQDGRQLMDWAARGTHPIILGAVQTDVEQFLDQGFSNIEVLSLKDKTGATGALVGGFSVLKQPKQADGGLGPHPNAATVFINWYASKPGQEVYSKVMLEPSVRTDVEIEEVPEYVIPEPGVEYLDTYEEEWFKEKRPKVTEEIIEALGGR